jgi:hypothetical protein
VLTNDELLEALRHRLYRGEMRVTLYFNRDRVDETFGQRLGPLHALTVGDSSSGEVSGGLAAGLVNLVSKVTHGKNLSAAVEFSPITQAMLLEYYYEDSNTLCDLSHDELPQGGLVRYVGPGKIALGEVTSDATMLSSDAAQIVQWERAQQEWVARELLGGEHPTLVWMAQDKHVMVSIAFRKCANVDNLPSYVGQDRFGILGRMENQKHGVVFISPFWIWYPSVG